MGFNSGFKGLSHFLRSANRTEVILLWNSLYSKGYRTELNKIVQDTRKEGHNIERMSLRRVEDDRTENEGSK